MHGVYSGFLVARAVYEEISMKQTSQSSSPNKMGFTLMELLVYMGIATIVVLIAGQAFSDSAKMRVRTQSMMEANELAESVGALIRDDVAQMGAKSSISSNNESAFNSNVYIDVGGGDFSSYEIVPNKNGSGLDELKFLKMTYGNDGAYRSVEEILWYAQNDHKLYRSCKTIDGTASDDCPSGGAQEIEMADGIDKFVVQPAQPNVDAGLIFPNDGEFRLISYMGGDNYVRVNTNPNNGGPNVTITDFATNYNEAHNIPENPIKHLLFVGAAGDVNNDWSSCESFTVKPDSIYEVSFSMTNHADAARMFRPGKDHMAIGLRRSNKGPFEKFEDLDDFMIYPPQSDAGNMERTIQFSTKQKDDEEMTACLAFMFVFYAPTANMGSFTISDLKLRQVGSAYSFSDAFVPSPAEKKDVRALRINLVVKKNGESGSSAVVVPIPSNGTKN